VHELPLLLTLSNPCKPLDTVNCGSDNDKQAFDPARRSSVVDRSGGGLGIVFSVLAPHARQCAPGGNL
jgi:hypothetical protein